MQLSVVIPAYNEARSIRKSLLAVNRQVSAKIRGYEIILVDDGSVDGTRAEAIKAAKNIDDNKIRVFGYDKNAGKGFALRYGASRARGDYLSLIHI